MITKFILFPGAYLRGFFEQMTCKILHLETETTGYLRADESIGHVEHTLATTTASSWFMATLPGFFTFNMGITFFALGLMNIFYLGITPYDSIPLFIVYCVAIYFGASLLDSAFPMTDDIICFWGYAYRRREHKNIFTRILSIILKVLLFPFALITRIGAFCEKYCINFLLLAAIVVLHIIFVL